MPALSLPFPARADLARVLISPARRDASTPIGRTGAAATSCRPTPLASRPRPSTSPAGTDVSDAGPGPLRARVAIQAAPTRTAAIAAA